MGKIETVKFISKNGYEVTIRTAKLNDAESVFEIDKSVADEGIYMLREPGESQYKSENIIKDIEEHSGKSGSLFIVSEMNNKVTGYLEFTNGRLLRTAHAGMFQMFIHKEYRDSGTGKMLLDSLIKWAEKNPLIEKLTLNVFSTNKRAIHLYTKTGFKTEGRCPKDMKLKDGTYIDSVLMYMFVKQFPAI